MEEVAAVLKDPTIKKKKRSNLGNIFFFFFFKKNINEGPRRNLLEVLYENLVKTKPQEEHILRMSP